jgi:hypothetical protein
MHRPPDAAWALTSPPRRRRRRQPAARQRLLVRLGPEAMTRGPLGGPAAAAAAAGVWEAVVRFDRMRVALLLAGLRNREPDGSAAHAILLFHLTGPTLARLLASDELPPAHGRGRHLQH